MLVAKLACLSKLNGTQGCCKRAFIVKMPEIVESKQYELFCNEQMIKSEFRQMWANKKRRNISHLRGSVLGCTPK